MKFKEIELRRNSVEPELDATPYMLSEEELRAIQGGWECGVKKTCGKAGRNSCIDYKSCGENGENSCGEYTWRISLEEYFEE